MFSEIEQEEIINEFLNTIEINDIIRSIHSNIQKCKKCKFNNVNIQLYKTHLPQNIVKNICKYNYVECQKCKMLKNLKEYVNENTVKSSKGFQTIITNIEKDEEPPQAYYKQQNIEEYFLLRKEGFQHINIYKINYCIMIQTKNFIQKKYIIGLRRVMMNIIMDILKVYAVVLMMEIV